MKRDFLRDLGLEKDVINEIMKAHGLAMREVSIAYDVDEFREDNEQIEQQLADLHEQLENQTAEGIKSDIERLKKEIEGYELTELKWRIANECKLPFDMADRLSGTTEDELRADAKQLVNYVKHSPQTIENFSGKDSMVSNLLRKISE